MNDRRLILLASLLATACAARRPVLYPNENLDRAGTEAAQRQVDECMQRAESVRSSTGPASDVARDVAIGGGSGAAAGAVGGAIAGNPGIGAAAGAASGATWGLLTSLLRPHQDDPVYVAYVDRCLREQGYEPIGWK